MQCKRLAKQSSSNHFKISLSERSNRTSNFPYRIAWQKVGCGWDRKWGTGQIVKRTNWRMRNFFRYHTHRFGAAADETYSMHSLSNIYLSSLYTTMRLIRPSFLSLFSSHSRSVTQVMSCTEQAVAVCGWKSFRNFNYACFSMYYVTKIDGVLLSDPTRLKHNIHTNAGWWCNAQRNEHILHSQFEFHSIL